MQEHHGFKGLLYDLLEDTGNYRNAAKIIQNFFVILITLNVIWSVIETIPEVSREWGDFLQVLQLFSGVVFMLEYLLRLYVSDLHPPLRRYGPLGARFRYALRLEAIVDLLAALPLLLVFMETDKALTGFVVLRLLRFLKLARYSPALRSLISALAAERQALMGSLVIIGGVILFAATLLYMAEHDVQPEKLASIPHAIWWAVATVTTVGYGDLVPLTGAGKIIGVVVMLAGYALIALPVGIVASAFAREIHSRDFVVTWSMVARVPLFEELKAAEIAEVTKLLKAQKVFAGTVIADKGDVADRMYFIVDGEVQINFTNETIYMGEGKFFGELALIHQRRRSSTVTAFHDCDLLVLEAADLTHLMGRFPDLAAKILKEAEERTSAGLRRSGDLVEEEVAQAEMREELIDEEGGDLDFSPDEQEAR